ncbi:MAG TPA: hypothetical protein VGJ81_00685 [Thermoanaerobaculia bacterium]|jgi:hypothetical protein
MKRVRVPVAVSFTAVFVVAMLLATILFRAAQQRLMNMTGAAPTVTALNEAQKLYLETRVGTSELLFNISFALIGGLLALHFGAKRRSPLHSHAILSACALLLASIYSAFLFHVGVSYCLEASPNDLYSPITNYPIVAQFWFLFGSVILLTVSLLRRMPQAGIGLLAAVCLLGSRPTFAASVEGDGYAQCARKWSSGRSLELSAQAIRDAVTVTQFVVQRDALEPAKEDRCTVTATLLDRIRFEAFESESVATQQQVSVAVAKQLRSAAAATRTTNVSLGDLLDDLVSIGEIWRVKAGIVEFVDEVAQQALFITVVSETHPPVQRKGRARWIVRLPPGKYDVAASSGAEEVFSDTIEIHDGDRATVVVRGKKP